MHGIETQPIDLVAAQQETRIVEEKVDDLLLPHGKSLPPRRWMAVNKVDAASRAGIARRIAVVLPVAVVGDGCVVVHHIENHSQAALLSSVNERDKVCNALV